jgi:putative ABC transport system permease protein
LYYSKGLIAFQFTIVIILLICTWIIIRQTTFAKNYDTGFRKDNILCIQNTLSSDQKESFKEKMYHVPGVENVVYVAGSPLDGGNNWSFRYNEVPLSFQVFVVDTGFFEMFGMKVTETGATYTQDAMWLNETAVKVTGLGSLPQRFEGFQNNPPVLGVVADFNFRDLRQRVGPAMIYPMNANRNPWQILIKISDKGIINTVDKIKSAYNDFTNGLPLEMSFIDETMEMWYQREERTARITGYFTILAITISVLGILAMSLYYIQQKIKEIGIRKVTGANIGEIITMLGTDYILWVVIAFIIATPISWYAMNKWLETFAYRIKMDWWLFALSGIGTLILALVSVGFQSWRAARRNPVEALRYE